MSTFCLGVQLKKEHHHTRHDNTRDVSIMARLRMLNLQLDPVKGILQVSPGETLLFDERWGRRPLVNPHSESKAERQRA